MFYAILSLCLVGSAMAQVPSLGRCPEMNTTPNFDISKYMGKWYESGKYFSEFEIGGKCISAEYTLGKENTVNMENSEIFILTGKSWTVKATARIPDMANPSKLKVKLDNVPFGIEADYWVLGTDYDNYAVVYNCYNVGLWNVKHAWIFTRDRNATQAIVDEAFAVGEENGLKQYLFLKSDQSHCETKQS